MCKLKLAVVHAVWLTLLFASGCIVSDQLTTFTVHPDGSADLVALRSNIRSTQRGEKAEKEMEKYRAKFNERSESEMARIVESDGEIVAAGWVREQVPSANYLHARFPNAAALEKFGTTRDAEGKPDITTHFESKGRTRRLTVRFADSGTNDVEEAAPADVQQLRQKMADGISEIRIAVTGGSITSERGFTVAQDKQSALPDFTEMAELFRKSDGEVELFLEWEVTE